MKISFLSKRKIESPKFDFLKTISVSSTPQPPRKEKKMLLSMFKNLKRDNTLLIEQAKKNLEDITPKRRCCLSIEGLVPVPINMRVKRRVFFSSKRLSENTIKIKFHSRRQSPY